MKIFIITNIPSPYRISLFNRLNQDFEHKKWELHVVFLTKSYKRRKWEVNENEFHFNYQYLKDWHLSLGEGFSSLALSLPLILIKNRPDLIVTAGFSLASLWTLIYSKMFNIPFLIWSGETIAEDRLRKRFRWLRSILRYLLIHSASAFIAYGTRAKEYLLRWKPDPKKIFIGINTVDTEFISDRVKELRLHKNEIIVRRGIPHLNILFIGYLEKRKGVHCILEAVKRIQNEQASFHFGTHIVGSGPEEEPLKGFVKKEGLRDVYFWGFRQKEEIPEFLAFSDLLLFTSIQELYGLVPIEAMAGRVPVLCTIHAGCTVDLIEDSINGLIIDPIDVDVLANKVIYCLKNPDFLSTLAKNAEKRIVNNFSIAHSSKGFVAAMEFSLLREKYVA